MPVHREAERLASYSHITGRRSHTIHDSESRGWPVLPYVSLPLSDFTLHPFPTIYHNHEYNKLPASYLSPSSELLRTSLPSSSVGKESTCSAGDPGSILGLGRYLGEGKPLQASCLENPMDRGAWQATVHGILKLRVVWGILCQQDSLQGRFLQILVCLIYTYTDV